MRICFIVGQLGPGGAERQLYYSLKTIKQFAEDVYVLSLTASEYWEQQIKDLGVDVIWVGKSNSVFLRIIAIFRELNRRPVDFIQSQHFYTNLYTVFAARVLHIKEIGAIRSDVFSEIAGMGRLGGMCLKLPKLIAANSKAAISNAIICGRRKEEIFFLPNVVDENIFSPILQQRTSPIIIIFIGTIWAPKRIDRVVKLAKKSQDLKMEVLYKIYGDGNQKRELLEMANDLGVLNNNLFFYERLTDTRKAYQEADIFILTSDYEGTPNVILEAMSCGLPIISMRVGDVPLLVEQSVNGFLAENEDQLFEAVKKMINIVDLMHKMGIANREKIVSQYSLHSLKEYLMKLYGLKE